jgi:hypothetical protein
MSSGILDRARARGLDVRNRRSMWMLGGFIALGFIISISLTLLSGTSSYGVLIAAGGMLLAVPAIALIMAAFPAAVANLRTLKANWTWWHPLWFCIYMSTLVFRIRDVGNGQGNLVDAWAMLRILPESFVSLTLITRLILKKPNWLGSLFRGIPCALTIYCLVSLASCAWSVNAAWTAYKSLEFLADVSLLAAVVASSEGFITWDSVVHWTLAFYGLQLIGVWINLPIWPNDAMDGGRLTGVFPVEASNSVGTSGAVLAIIAFCRLLPAFGVAKNRAWYVLLFLFGMASMVLSKTRNAEGAFLLAVVMVAVFSKRHRKMAIWGAVVLAPVLAVATAINSQLPGESYDVVMSAVNRDQSEGAIGTLSGRTGWWEYGLQQLSHHPFTGMGAYAAGRFAVLGKLGVGQASMMHSDWIEVVIGTSFWGLIPFAGALFATWWYLFRCIRGEGFPDEQRQLALEMFALLGLLTLHSFFNDELAWHCPLLYFSILGYANFIRLELKSRYTYVPARQRLSSQRYAFEEVS